LYATPLLLFLPLLLLPLLLEDNVLTYKLELLADLLNLLLCVYREMQPST
jgi:hypothetical protein